MSTYAYLMCACARVSAHECTCVRESARAEKGRSMHQLALFCVFVVYLNNRFLNNGTRKRAECPRRWRGEPFQRCSEESKQPLLFLFSFFASEETTRTKFLSFTNFPELTYPVHHVACGFLDDVILWSEYVSSYMHVAILPRGIPVTSQVHFSPTADFDLSCCHCCASARLPRARLPCHVTAPSSRILDCQPVLGRRRPAPARQSRPFSNQQDVSAKGHHDQKTRYS